MRLVTRADLDGLACAILIKHVEEITEVDFAHPKDVQDGKVPLGPNDILTNLPHDPRAALWFDHHASQEHHAAPASYRGAFGLAPSAARVVADHYKHPDFARYTELLEETDRLDSANLNIADVLEPEGWILLGYTLDPRTGLGPFKEYFLKIISMAQDHTIAEILKDPEVQERIATVRRDQEAFLASLKLFSRVDGNVIVTDVRGQKGLPSGNRFLVYTIFPSANVSVRIADGKGGLFVSVQVGHSIFNRTCKTHVGELMHQYGGGGHKGAGTCQPKAEEAEQVIAAILKTLRDNG